MNVANKDLCAELYELSGWKPESHYPCWVDNATVAHAQDGYPKLSSNIGIRGEWEYGKQYGLYIMFPAYDLGYLLRKLPAIVEIHSYTKFYKVRYINMKIFSAEDIVAEADTPEDALGGLTIELFKQGILEKEHPECRNNGKCSGHDIEEPVEVSNQIEEQAELRKKVDYELGAYAHKYHAHPDYQEPFYREYHIDAIMQLLSKQKENWEKELKEVIGESSGSDMNDDELIHALSNVYQWGIGTGRRLESGKLKRVDEREWEIVASRLDRFEQTFNNRFRRKLFDHLSSTQQINPKESE